MPNHHSSGPGHGQRTLSKSEIGRLGEDFVADQLRQRGWTIIQQQWRCRWGELDLIAQIPEPVSCVVMVEVKVRSQGNWDSNGLLSITSKKQQKLLHTAHLFLAEYPDFACIPCRFDVALVKCQRPFNGAAQHSQLREIKARVLQQEQMALPSDAQSSACKALQTGYCFRLQHYIEGAFDAGNAYE